MKLLKIKLLIPLAFIACVSCDEEKKEKEPTAIEKLFESKSDKRKREKEEEEARFEREVKPDLVEKYKCGNVDDCVSKYEFEGARAYMAALNSSAREPELLKIIKAESTFLVKNGEVEKAFQVIEETQFSYSNQLRDNMKYQLYYTAVDYCLNQNDFNKARKIALKAPRDIEQVGNYFGPTSDENRSIKANLLKYIADFERLNN